MEIYMGIIYPGVPIWIAEFGHTVMRIEFAVETGTHVGKSALALSAVYERVLTIESNEQLLNKAKLLNSNVKNIEYRIGTSSDMLRDLFPVIREGTFFWLDAHYSGGETSGEEYPCPVIEELIQIQNFEFLQDSLICIDDARLFGGPHDLAPSMQGWPRLFPILKIVDEMQMSSFLIDDVIVCLPTQHEQEFMLSYISRSNPTKENMHGKGRRIGFANWWNIFQ
jgi:hypothetical protein